MGSLKISPAEFLVLYIPGVPKNTSACKTSKQKWRPSCHGIAQEADSPCLDRNESNPVSAPLLHQEKADLRISASLRGCWKDVASRCIKCNRSCLQENVVGGGGGGGGSRLAPAFSRFPQIVKCPKILLCASVYVIGCKDRQSSKTQGSKSTNNTYFGPKNLLPEPEGYAK